MAARITNKFFMQCSVGLHVLLSLIVCSAPPCSSLSSSSFPKLATARRMRSQLDTFGRYDRIHTTGGEGRRGISDTRKRGHFEPNHRHPRDGVRTTDESVAALPSRRNLFATAALLRLTTAGDNKASAQEGESVVEQVTPEEIAELSGGYNNPNIPPSPEERSGLVVLRVAEVAQYQEKLIRAVVNKDLDIVISPQQIVFGTQILLRNSQIAGNMKLMIEEEIPARRKKEARQVAAASMNTIQAISSSAAKVERPFEDLELLSIADLYQDLRLQLNQLYEYLPSQGKEKYDGYFVAVTEYEKKIAEGTYNPDTDGILRFDD